MTNIVRLIITAIVIIISHELLVVEGNAYFRDPDLEPEECEDTSVIPYLLAKALSILIALVFWRLLGGTWV